MISNTFLSYRGGHSADCEYEAPGIAMDTNPAYDMVNTYDKVGES